MFKIQKILHADYIAFMCFVRISEQTATFALYCINLLNPTGHVMHQQCNIQ